MKTHGGSRGVTILYLLTEGEAYEVCDPRSWRRNDRYFCHVADGEIIRVTEEELEEWLKYHSEPPY